MSSDKVLDEILKDKGTPNLEREKEDALLEPLLPEIELIKEPRLQGFVRSLLLKAGPFWFIPASFTGEYHPPDERDEGGNVLHTKRVVRTALLFADSYSLEEEERDMLIAAAILHDITKGVTWVVNELPSYDPMHAYTVDRFVRMVRVEDTQFSSENKSSSLFLDEDSVQAILRLIRCHMGVWGPIPETYPVYALEMALHLSDMVASHLHKIIDGEEAENNLWRWGLPEQE